MRPAVPLLLVLTLAVASLGTSIANHDDELALPEHPAGACSAPFHVQWAGWDFCWQQDNARAQGIELNQAYFHGESVLWKIGLPFTLTRYEADTFGPFKDTLGQSIVGGDNPGFGRGSMAIHPSQCPRLLTTGVLLNDNQVCLEHRSGPEPATAIWARYDIFNYRFIQGYQLDARGVLEPFVRLGGHLIDGEAGGASGTNHFHHVYWRADFDIGDPGDDAFQMFLRPHEAWNDWDPYLTWTPSGNEATPTASMCARIPVEWTPPPCRGLESDGNFTLVDPLAGLPQECRQQVLDGVTGWCDIPTETLLAHHPALFTKWRVRDATDRNEFGNPKSFETGGHSHYDAAIDGEFATFHALVLQHQGDTREIGFEVPAHPVKGDTYLHAYLDPPETIQDPVAWFAVHTYHDTRDEEKPSMVYHHVSFLLEPRDFLDGNPGEDTFAGGPSISPPGIGPGECIGAICV